MLIGWFMPQLYAHWLVCDSLWLNADWLVQIFWNDSGELLCIATEESFFILSFKADAVERAKEHPEAVTEDGIEEAFEVSLLGL